MQTEVIFNMRAQDNTHAVVKPGVSHSGGSERGILALAQNISFTMKTI